MMEGLGGTLRAGECAHCGTLNLINEAGLCPACRELPACALHADQRAERRCLRCRLPHCKGCLEHGVCAACHALPAPAAPARAEEPPAEPTGFRFRFAAGPARLGRRHLIGALVLGLALCLAGQQAYERVGPPAERRASVARLGAALDAAQAIRNETGRPPRDAGVLADRLRRSLPHAPQVLPQSAAPVPDAVYYRARGRHFELRATDNQGRWLERDGRVWVVTGG